jgi:hypothetical protein
MEKFKLGAHVAQQVSGNDHSGHDREVTEVSGHQLSLGVLCWNNRHRNVSANPATTTLNIDDSLFIS